MTNEKKLELLAEIFECEKNLLNINTNLEQLPTWDSMTKLSLIVMIEDECGKKITANELRAFTTVGDIMTYME